MKKYISCVFVLCCVVQMGRSQIPLVPPRITEILPPPEVFLSVLFNRSGNDIINIANNFQFAEIESNDIKFLLYKTKNNVSEFEFVDYKDVTPTKPTKFFIHGWFGNGNDTYISDIGRKYHDKGDYNFITIDWSTHSKSDYIRSTSISKNIGKHIGQFILNMTKGEENLLNNMHIIGHSLGAQVAGYAGKEVIEKSGHKIGRITGLDAAAPLFEYPMRVKKSERLSEDDAHFVDGIHTNIGFLGYVSPFAKADFYVNNGGPIQPGCVDVNVIETVVCSHGTAVELFTDSISSDALIATHCPNPLAFISEICSNNKAIVMGEGVPHNITGTYYIRTNPRQRSRNLFSRL